ARKHLPVDAEYMREQEESWLGGLRGYALKISALLSLLDSSSSHVEALQQNLNGISLSDSSPPLDLDPLVHKYRRLIDPESLSLVRQSLEDNDPVRLMELLQDLRS